MEMGMDGCEFEIRSGLSMMLPVSPKGLKWKDADVMIVTAVMTCLMIMLAFSN